VPKQVDYAAILAPKDKEITLKEITEELSKYNWNVVSKEIEDFEDIPSYVLVWMLFDWKTLGYPDFPCQGYVRIVAGEGKNDMRTYFHVVQSPWYAVIYYNILLWGDLQIEKIRRLIRRNNRGDKS
jgi:hypothetical protein